MKKKKIKRDKIADCGTNCGICPAHLTKKDKCEGCKLKSGKKPKHCFLCDISNCSDKCKGELCYECKKFPCKRIKKLSKTYEEKYSYNLIDNLLKIREIGLDEYLKLENINWVCTECGEEVSFRLSKF